MAEIRDLLEVGGHQQDRQALGGRLVEQPVDRRLGTDVPARSRLLEDQQPRPSAERPPENHLRLIASGQRGDGHLAVAGAHREPFDQSGGLAPLSPGTEPVPRRHTARPGVGQEVLPDRQIRRAALLLTGGGHDADSPTERGCHARRVIRLAVGQDPAAEQRQRSRESSTQARG